MALTVLTSLHDTHTGMVDSSGCQGDSQMIFMNRPYTGEQMGI